MARDGDNLIFTVAVTAKLFAVVAAAVLLVDDEVPLNRRRSLYEDPDDDDPDPDPDDEEADVSHELSLTSSEEQLLASDVVKLWLRALCRTRAAIVYIVTLY